MVRLCRNCKGALKYRLGEMDVDLNSTNSPHSTVDAFAHHFSWRSLWNSVLDACWICRELWNALPSSITFIPKHSRIPTILVEEDNKLCRRSASLSSNIISAIGLRPWDSGAIDILMYQVHDGLFISRTQFHAIIDLTTRDDFMSTHGDGTRWEDSTAHSTSLRIAESWLSSCTHSHPECQMAIVEQPWYPTRLLQVTALDAETHGVRLILTNEDRPDGPYATLSHCWGDIRYVQLTRSNMRRFQSQLDTEEMPRTFQEAIAVCKVLHIEYLWIDSLCILQDDTSDWAHEAGLMHKVYSHSHCNLSASDAGNGTHGLFRQRDASILDLVSFRICQRDANGVLGTRLYSVQERYLWNDSVADSIINKRGWVFQERLLAPRILHFTHDQLFWECRVHSACEKYPSGFMESALEGSDFKRSLDYNKYAAKAALHTLTPEDVATCYKIWNKIVEQYTTASLTRPSDKLIAISGVAQALASILDDEYCAGMWRRDLETQLLWHRGEDSTPYTRPEIYRAPSWSWASLDGSIAMIARTFDSSDFKAHIEDVVLVHETEDITGQVRHGHLDMRGELKPLCLSPNLHWPHENNIHIVVQKARWSTEAYMRHIDTNTGFDVSGVPAARILNDSWERRLFYMTIVASRDYVAALMLRLVADEGIYERIGLIELIPGVEDNDGFENAFLAGLDDRIRKTLPCRSYEDGKHTVRIV